MFRKTIIRFTFFMLVLSGILIVVVAKADQNSLACQAPAEQVNESGGHESHRGDFIIWESFARSLMSSVHY